MSHVLPMKRVQVRKPQSVYSVPYNWTLVGICTGGSCEFDFPVEESLQPSLLRQHESTEDRSHSKRSSLLADQLQEYQLAKEGGYLGLQDYVNFTEVDLST